MIVAAMGVGCRGARVTRLENAEVVCCQWADGRTATYRGLLDGPGTFGAVIHRAQGVQMIDSSQARRPFYASLLEVILHSLPDGRGDIEPDAMLEVVRVIEMANAARRDSAGAA